MFSFIIHLYNIAQLVYLNPHLLILLIFFLLLSKWMFKYIDLTETFLYFTAFNDLLSLSKWELNYLAKSIRVNIFCLPLVYIYPLLYQFACILSSSQHPNHLNSSEVPFFPHDFLLDRTLLISTQTIHTLQPAEMLHLSNELSDLHLGPSYLKYPTHSVFRTLTSFGKRMAHTL